jgi:hypothetical protein
MPPRKSCAKAKADDGGAHSQNQTCTWAKNPDWTFTLIEYLGDNVGFCLKLFSDSTADTARENWPKLTAKESKSQQYAILAKHIFSTEPGQSALFLQDPGRYGGCGNTSLTVSSLALSPNGDIHRTLSCFPTLP